LDLLTPNPNAKILWSFQSYYLVKFRSYFRSYGYLVDTRKEAVAIAGLTQKVFVVARMYNARQCFHARHYLEELKNAVPYALDILSEDFWALFELKTDELHLKPHMIVNAALEEWNDRNPD